MTTTLTGRIDRLIPLLERSHVALGVASRDDRADSCAQFAELCRAALDGAQPAAASVPRWVGP